MDEGCGCCSSSKFIQDDEFKVFGRLIRLADVLLAISDCKNFLALWARAGKFGIVNRFDKVYWNLRADDLEKQSEETINFLYELLERQSQAAIVGITTPEMRAISATAVQPLCVSA